MITLKNNTAIKIIGTLATLLGVGATLMSDWVNRREMDSMIEEKINEMSSKKIES